MPSTSSDISIVASWCVRVDGAFQNETFETFLVRYDIQIRLATPLRHHKNMTEPRHRVIGSILYPCDTLAYTPTLAFLLFRHFVFPTIVMEVTVSSFGLAKGFPWQVFSSHTISPVSHDVLEAYVNINTNRKLNPILRSRMFSKDTFKVRDTVQAYLTDDKAKRGTWSSPRIILSPNQEAVFVILSSRARKHIYVAFEDTRAVHDGCALSNLVQSAIDELD